MHHMNTYLPVSDLDGNIPPPLPPPPLPLAQFHFALIVK